MQTRLPVQLAILALLTLTPMAAHAVDCGNYPLTKEQQQYIEELSLPIQVPEGDVPVIQRCDTNGDEVVDIEDIRAIRRKWNQPAAHPDDPMDWDGNGVINVFDMRGCRRACDSPNCDVNCEKKCCKKKGCKKKGCPKKCKVNGRESAPLELSKSSAPQGGVVEDTACFQVLDLSGDGEDDFVGIYEHTDNKSKSDNRGGGWTLELVIIYKDDNGNMRHMINPYAGQRSEKEGKLFQHLSMQPAGMVDLMPGSVKIDKPGVVSYRHGIPRVLYYYQNGKMNRAFYGVDD